MGLKAEELFGLFLLDFAVLLANPGFECLRLLLQRSFVLRRSVAFILECVGHALKRKKPPMVTRYAVWLMGRRCFFSADKARTELGWQSTVPYEQGVKRTIAWLRQQEAAQPPS